MSHAFRHGAHLIAVFVFDGLRCNIRVMVRLFAITGTLDAVRHLTALTNLSVFSNSLVGTFNCGRELSCAREKGRDSTGRSVVLQRIVTLHFCGAFALTLFWDWGVGAAGNPRHNRSSARLDCADLPVCDFEFFQRYVCANARSLLLSCSGCLVRVHQALIDMYRMPGAILCFHISCRTRVAAFGVALLLTKNVAASVNCRQF